MTTTSTKQRGVYTLLPLWGQHISQLLKVNHLWGKGAVNNTVSNNLRAHTQSLNWSPVVQQSQQVKCETHNVEDLTLRLSGWVIHLQIEGLGVGALHYSDIVSSPFVSFGQSIGSPVSPVHLSSIHGDSKRVGQILVTPQHLNQSRSIIHGRVDGIWP